MNLAELLPLLNALGSRPKKALSQNFLIDGNIAQKIVKTAAVQPGEAVLEIGPGPGALTALLLEAKAKVFAVEKDPVLARALERLQNGKLQVFHADALEFPWAALPAPLKIVANLPYHITTPLLEKIFSEASRFSSLTLMVQKEVAERLRARPRTKEYGSLTLFARAFSTLVEWFPVRASCFYPRPKVDSAVIHLQLCSPPQDPEPLLALIRRAFQQRRKMLSSSLKSLLPREKIEEALLSMGRGKTARPEELSFEEWVRFANLC